MFGDALGRRLPAGIRLGHRPISLGDEYTLFPEELASIQRDTKIALRASGAARIVARQLLSECGYLSPPIPRGADGVPLWPSGVVGSLAHDRLIAVGAIGMKKDFAAIGIDIEPSQLLPPDMLDVIATPSEKKLISIRSELAILYFAAKEAVYKAVYPLDGRFLEYTDVEIDITRQQAFVRHGRVVSLRLSAHRHVVALAFIEGDSAQRR
jgi:4'-phosphopantetheinyl transferase EntD